MQDEYVSVEHLLLGLIEDRDNSVLHQFFNQFSIDSKKVLKAMQEIRGNQRVTSQNPEATYQSLENMVLISLSMRVGANWIRSLGAMQKFAESSVSFSRKTKNNPVLIGDPGVGKTAIVEGLAQRIVRGDVPEGLKDRTGYALDMGALLAGAKYRGEFENASKQCFRK